MRKHTNPVGIILCPMPTIKSFHDLTGQKFGRLTVVEFHGKKLNNRGHGIYFWRCLCGCGTVKSFEAGHLVKGNTVSCSCYRDEQSKIRTKKLFTKHGQYLTGEYRSWMSMRERCGNPEHPAYKHYGGKGVKICDRWSDFKLFQEDVGTRPDGCSIDRYPNRDGDYEPGNVRWATDVQQARNTSRNRMLTFNGQTLCLTEWGEKMGIGANVIHGRLKRGLSVEQALTTPLGKIINKRKPKNQHPLLATALPANL